MPGSDDLAGDAEMRLDGAQAIATGIDLLGEAPDMTDLLIEMVEASRDVAEVAADAGQATIDGIEARLEAIEALVHARELGQHDAGELVDIGAQTYTNSLPHGPTRAAPSTCRQRLDRNF